MELKPNEPEKKEIGIKVLRGEEEIPVDELKVILDFDGTEAEVELKNAVIRSMVLAQENILLKNALAQAKAIITGKAPQAKPQRFYEGEE